MGTAARGARANPPAAQALDHQGEITAAVKSGDISGKAGSTLLIRSVTGVAAERVLL
ncbi:MAG: M17 family peptidase N-terminal domain-containing protein, partial [Pseudomonadota bacterium]